MVVISVGDVNFLCSH